MILQTLFFLIGTAQATTPILPSSTTEFSGKMDGSELLITLTPPQHHHFNLKAPSSLQRKKDEKKMKPFHKHEHKIQFKVPHPQSEDFEVTLFLCDDAKTGCEKQSKELHWDSGKAHLSIQN